MSIKRWHLFVLFFDLVENSSNIFFSEKSYLVNSWISWHLFAMVVLRVHLQDLQDHQDHQDRLQVHLQYLHLIMQLVNVIVNLVNDLPLIGLKGSVNGSYCDLTVTITRFILGKKKIFSFLTWKSLGNETWTSRWGGPAPW